MVLSRMLRVAVTDAGMATVPGFSQADTVGRVAALDAFQVSGNLANDAAAPRDRQSVHAT
jgi:hypothetical protein